MSMSVSNPLHVIIIMKQTNRRFSTASKQAENAASLKEEHTEFTIC